MKKTKTTNTDLLQLALEELGKTAGITGTVRPGRKGQAARITLKFPNRAETVELPIDIKAALGGAAAMHITMTQRDHVLVTHYVNPRMAVRFRDAGVQFIDCAGNAYLNTGAFFVLIKGNPPKERGEISPGRLFKPGGLQVIFALLCNPVLAKAPYREIAARACVALGTAAWAIGELQKQGYILDLGNKDRRLAKRETLLRMWLVGYEQLLRPRFIANRYHAEKPDWWEKAIPEGMLWGGEIAAYKLTGFLKPQRVTLYTQKLPAELVIRNRLHVDPKGEIDVLVPFWDFDYPEKKDGLVPPLLVYADLMVQADGRTAETAKMVYDKFLARHLSEA